MPHRARVPFGCLLSVVFAIVPSGAFSQDLERQIDRIQFNLLANASLVSRATAGDIAVPQWLTVSFAGNATPIEVVTPIAHGLSTGDAVLIKGVLGNVAANGWWTITSTAEKRVEPCCRVSTPTPRYPSPRDRRRATR